MHRNDPLIPAALPRRGFLSNLGATVAGLLTIGVATRTTTASAERGLLKLVTRFPKRLGWMVWMGSTAGSSRRPRSTVGQR